MRALFLAALLAGTSSWASTDTRRVLVPLEKDAEDLRAAAWVPAASPGYGIEVSASGRGPEHLSAPSRIAGASDFVATSLPSLGASALLPLRQGFTLRLGMVFSELRRTGPINVAGGAPATTEQSLFLFSSRAGADWRPSRLRWRALGLKAGAELGPVWAISARSVFDEGTSSLGIGGEASAGGYLDFGPAELTFDWGSSAVRILDRSPIVFGVRAGLAVRL